jgi:hypothetical protein
MSTERVVVNRGLWLLAGALAGAALSHAFRHMRVRPDVPGEDYSSDPSIPPSESSATRFRDKPGYAQEDPDQEEI